MVGEGQNLSDVVDGLMHGKLSWVANGVIFESLEDKGKETESKRFGIPTKYRETTFIGSLDDSFRVHSSNWIGSPPEGSSASSSLPEERGTGTV